MNVAAATDVIAMLGLERVGVLDFPGLVEAHMKRNLVRISIGWVVPVSDINDLREIVFVIHVPIVVINNRYVAVITIISAEFVAFEDCASLCLAGRHIVIRPMNLSVLRCRRQGDLQPDLFAAIVTAVFGVNLETFRGDLESMVSHESGGEIIFVCIARCSVFVCPWILGTEFGANACLEKLGEFILAKLIHVSFSTFSHFEKWL